MVLKLVSVRTKVLGGSFDRLCWMAKGLGGPGSTQIIVLSDSLEFTDCIEGGKQQSDLLTGAVSKEFSTRSMIASFAFWSRCSRVTGSRSSRAHSKAFPNHLRNPRAISGCCSRSWHPSDAE